MRLRWCCAGHVGQIMSCGYETQVVLCWACGEEDELWLQGSSGVVLGMWGRE